MMAALRPRPGRPALFRTFTMKTVCVITLFVRIAVSACLFAAVPRAFSQPYCKVRMFTATECMCPWIHAYAAVCAPGRGINIVVYTTSDGNTVTRKTVK